MAANAMNFFMGAPSLLVSPERPGTAYVPNSRLRFSALFRKHGDSPASSRACFGSIEKLLLNQWFEEPLQVVQGAPISTFARARGQRKQLVWPLGADLRACRSTRRTFAMRTFDLAPLYRSTVGFDRLFSLVDQLDGHDGGAPGYPPYNIERTGENDYRITVAVAGFAENELSIEAKENTLTIRGDN